MEPPAVLLTTVAGRVRGADATGAGNALLWIVDDGLRCETEPVTSFGAGPLRDENRLSLAKREESELQLTAPTAIAADRARRNHGSERIGSATQRIGPLTRMHTNDEGVKHSGVNKFLSLKDSLNPRAWTH